MKYSSVRTSLKYFQVELLSPYELNFVNVAALLHILYYGTRLGTVY